MPISERSEKAIKLFLQVWWADLTWKAHETVIGAQLPPMTGDQLYHQLLGLTLRQIANAAEGQAPDTEEERGEVYEACQQICEWMWARPGMPSTYNIPPEWWETPIGRLVMGALVWCQRDEFITPTEAARLAGVTPAAISQWLKRGRLQKFTDPNEPNPQYATRVRRSEVELLARR